ncbi:MAG TPA: GON domain-containing protein [Symbiobacteriaceae bacterium]
MKRLHVLILVFSLLLTLVMFPSSAVATAQPASCAAIKAANPGAGDGDYAIYANGKVLNVYCYDMGGTPREYLSLPKNGGDYNKSAFLSYHGTITTWYTKLRIDPAMLTVDTEDHTFATVQKTPGTIISSWWPDGYMEFGNGSGCDGRVASGNIDLTSTPFAIVRTSMTMGGGWFGIDWSSNDQVARPWGGGWCGYAHPAARYLQLAWLGPTLTASAPAANGNGWHNSDVTVTYSAAAGPVWALASVTPNQTISTEGANQSATGTAADTAGNTVFTTVSGINIDKIPPNIGGAPDCGASKYGWFQGVTINFTCADSLSGIADCTAPVTLGDGANQSVTGTAVDKAGNTAGTTLSNINVDTAPPTISYSVSPPNANGWYKAPVTVSFTCGDALSGIDSCPAPVTLTEAAKSATAVATDKAGNSTSVTVSLQVDQTAPTISGAADRGASQYGWFQGVTVNFTCADTLSGIADCTAPVTLGDGAGQSVTGTAVDKAGNTAGTTLNNINVDTVAPTISGAATTPANGFGWYKGDVTIHWTVGDALAGVDPGTVPADSVITGEGASLSANASVSDKAGNSAGATVSGIKIDRTNPVITATRTPANGFGWNKGAVTITFTCSDALSGVTACSAPVTLSLEGAGQSVTGTAVDKAGNSASITVSAVNIDHTAPLIAAARTPANSYGWNNADVTVSFDCSDALAGIAACSAPVTLSGEGAGQSVTGTAVDKADNSAGVTVSGINIDKTKPVVTYSGNAGSYTVDQGVSITCSSSDSLSGVAGDTCADIVGPAWSFDIGQNSYSATATDKAGNVGSGGTGFTVSTTYDSLCALGRQFSTSADVAQGLCDKLAAAKASDAKGNANSKAGQIKAYLNLVEAQTNKALTKLQAAILTRLVKLL